MEQFGDVFDGMVLTHDDGKGDVVDADRERAVERLRQLDDHVSQRLGGGDGGYHGIEPAHGKGLARGDIGCIEVEGVLLLEGEGKGGRADTGNGDHEHRRTTHTAIEHPTVSWHIGKMPE
jgi:hypothetical protein